MYFLSDIKIRFAKAVLFSLSCGHARNADRRNLTERRLFPFGKTYQVLNTLRIDLFQIVPIGKMGYIGCGVDNGIDVDRTFLRKNGRGRDISFHYQPFIPVTF